MINVALLGRMSLTIDDKRMALNLGPSGRLLAGYLFEFPGRVHRREQLGDMFWEDRAPGAARAALNTAQWRLRKLLVRHPQARRDCCIHSTADEVVFEPPADMRIDTHAFAGAVRTALESHAAAEREAHCHLLEEAAGRYSGHFLDGDEAEWIMAERERLHSLYIRCLCALMRGYAGRGDYESAIDAGKRVLGSDPFRETVMRTVAILLFLNGQRAQAIDELARWQAALRAQVGVGAMPETCELHSALVSGSICADIARWRQGHLAPHHAG